MKKTVAILCIICMVSVLGGCFKISVKLPAVNTPSENQAQPSSYVQNTQTAIPHTEFNSVQSTEQQTNQNEPLTQQNTTGATIKKPNEMSQEELLTYFSSALNAVKTEKAGFKKSKLTSIVDLKLSNSVANSLVSFVKGALLSDTADETLVNRGQSSDDIMSPPGKPYASALTSSDITGISAKQSGNGYIITVNIKDEVNPESGSAMSKVFDYMTVDDVVNIYAPKVGATVNRSDIEVTFSGCYAELTVDEAGHVVSYTTYVKGMMNMYNASIKKVVTINTDLFITLASTTNYTDFSY